MTNDPHRYPALIEKLRPYAWEHGIASPYVTSDTVLERINFAAYFSRTKQPLPDNRRHILEMLESDRPIQKDVGNKWNILNLGAVLFGEVEIFQVPAPLLKANDNSMQVFLWPAYLCCMASEERIRACYFHSVLRVISGERMRNVTPCKRLGVDPKNAAQATSVNPKTLDYELMKYTDEDHPRAGHHSW